MTARKDELLKALKLEPLGPEGGFFRETFRDTVQVSKSSLPDTFKGDRCFSTCIYYVLHEKQVSFLHRLASAEVWHFHLGRPLIITAITPDGSLSETTLGNDLAAGQVPQLIIQPGTWFGAHVGDVSKHGPLAALQSESDCGLVSCTVAPGFEFDDFEVADLNSMLQQYPQHKAVLERLCPPAQKT